MNITGMFTKTFQREIGLALVFYGFMAIIFYIALVIDTGWYNHYLMVSINHLLKALLTIPIWWLTFRYMATASIWKRILVHLITLPLFTIVWISMHYAICDQLGIRRGQGSRVIWEFYMTVLFYIIQFGIFHLYDYYKRLQQQQLIATQLEKLTLQSELSALKAQLNPHFLYNVFNTINAAIPATAKPAREMVNKLSDLFRYQLRASTEELIPLKEELEFVQKYLELEKERFGKRLSFEIEVEDDLLEVKVPPMLLQPIIENSVKHGISPLIEGGIISLHISKTMNSLKVVVSDTGAGINEQKKGDLLKRGIGLTNTNERLQKMYGMGLELTNNSPSGLIVRFSIPLNQEI